MSTTPPTNNPLNQPNNPPPKKSYTYYHAGPLFTLSDLHTNTLLSNLIHSISTSHPTNPTFTPLVPQNIELRDTSPHSIRDQDIRTLLSCDLALFTFDGTELDSGTVVEFCVAKFADVPAVILRTDFRGGGDQGGSDGGDPWNLMCSFWPRCEKVVVDGMAGYKTALAAAQGERNVDVDSDSKGVENVVAVGSAGGVAARAGEMLMQGVAERVVEAMGKVMVRESLMPKELREGVYQWIGMMAGFKGVSGEQGAKEMMEVLRGKKGRGLM